MKKKKRDKRQYNTQKYRDTMRVIGYLPEDLKEKMIRSARINQRTMSQEIVFRLAQTFSIRGDHK